MITTKNKEYLEKVREFAKSVGKLDQLEERLNYLGTYGEGAGRKTECHLFKDFAPYSFEILMTVWNEKLGDYEVWFNGGLIYHGPVGGKATEPYAVELNPTDGWSVHT